ncbi:MAG: hypothetical protein AMS27_06220 [Bacteroides sp. SM23_62_1]|nr:MAG: hypothetical protein AMS27_06220 [Bacteroides sp. SM23_62_1]
MKRIIFKYCFLLYLLIIPEILYSQTRITVTKPRLEATDESLVIEYDILNTGPSDIFVVWIEVTDAAGNKINAVSLTGDVGQEIKGGNNKIIIWNLGNDKILIDEDIFVEVKAEKIPEKEKTAETETPEETKTVKKEESSVERKTISKSNMVLSSVVLPGWGQTKASKGKPYWLLGVAGYGCLAGSITLNRMASSAYQDYKESPDPDEFNAFYDKAIQRDKISKYMAYSGIGIWVADLVWVLATPTSSQKSTASREDRKLKIIPGFDPGSNSTTVSLTYKF